MSDPERLLRSSGAECAVERALLGSLYVVTVPAQAKSELWSYLAAQGLGAAALGSSSGSTTGSSLWGALHSVAASKAVLALPVVMAMVGAGLWHRSAPQPTGAPAPRITAAAPPVELRDNPAASPDATAVPSEEDERAAVTLTPRKSRLQRESEQLTRARAELRAGNASAAQAILSRMPREFGTGALGQERDVLTIEAFEAQGNREAAERAARAFIAAHPESPHSQPLQRILTTR